MGFVSTATALCQAVEMFCYAFSVLQKISDTKDSDHKKFRSLKCKKCPKILTPEMFGFMYQKCLAFSLTHSVDNVFLFKHRNLQCILHSTVPS